ncbi:MAG: cobalamin-binding protein [Planctomycetia bacterium]
MRIVSLLPSATEIVCALGLGDRLVGVTHECDHPLFVLDLPKVTKTLIPPDAAGDEINVLVRERLNTRKALYILDVALLERLKPDLIVTQGLCDVCAVAEEEVTAAVGALSGAPRVVDLEPMRLDEVFDSLRIVGAAAGVRPAAEVAVAGLTARVADVARRTAELDHRPGLVFLEWIDPLFGAGHWMPELVRLAGGREEVGKEGRPSRRISWDEVKAVDPEVLVVACCGFTVERALGELPALRRGAGFADLACVRNGRVYVIDGNAYFSRPGPRLVDGLEILANALHPTVHPLPAGLNPARRLTPAELAGETER